MLRLSGGTFARTMFKSLERNFRTARTDERTDYRGKLSAFILNHQVPGHWDFSEWNAFKEKLYVPSGGRKLKCETFN